MTRNSKIILGILLVAIVVIVGVMIVRNNNNKNTNTTADVRELQEFVVQTMIDGTKLNTSSKLSEVKKVQNLEISNAQLTNKDNKTTFLADVKNVGTDKITMLDVEVVLLDEGGNTIKTLKGLLGTIAPNGAAQLNIEAVGNYTNIYDYKVNVK